MSWIGVLDFVTLSVTGFVSCAEFGSYAFVHPVIRRLPATQHIEVERGLLRTFGRVMPFGMTLCLVLAIIHASVGGVMAVSPSGGGWRRHPSQRR